jgi:hypothetical protein
MYVDVENLLDVDKEAIRDTFERWPEELPRPGLLHLYVKADNVGAWQLWATDAYPSLEIKVTGVQHYSLDGSKNSADIALALDAIVDLLKGRTSHVAILSDDSDFAILSGKIAQEIPKLGNGKLPFIWFQTDRPQTRSSMLNEFLPAHYMRTAICAKQKTATIKPKLSTQQKAVTKAKPPTKEKTAVTKAKPSAPTADEQGLRESLVKTIIRLIPVGSFGSTDCMKLIKQHFSKHPLAKLDSANFGNHFVKTLWPILETYGVRVNNPNRRPRRYEMTAEAKQKVGDS